MNGGARLDGPLALRGGLEAPAVERVLVADGRDRSGSPGPPPETAGGGVPSSSGWRERWRQRARLGAAQLAYRGCRKLLRRSGLHRWIDFSVRHFVSVPAWRLQLPQRLPRDLSVQEVGVAALPELEALRPGSGDWLRRRFAAGHRCMAAFLEPAAGASPPARRRCVAWVWMVPGPARVASSFGCVWQVPAGMLWLYDLYSDPNTLGALPHLNAALRARPPAAAPVLAGAIESDNQRSRQAHRSLGYREHAVLYTLRLGGRLSHVSHARCGSGWRRHAAHAAIPLQVFHPLPLPPRTAAGASAAPLRLRCSACGHGVAVATPLRCRCGLRVGEFREHVLVTGRAEPYWGEVTQACMQRILARGEQVGWRRAVRELAPPGLQETIAGTAGADFIDVLPLRAGSRVLDFGAGWGSVAVLLARQFRVVALEGVPERARFIAQRQRQDGIENLLVLNAPTADTALAPGQFDAVVADGALAWPAQGETVLPPRLRQLACLMHLRSLLAPGGVLCLGMENRRGWAELRAGHGGLSDGNSLPRLAAGWAGAHGARYRRRSGSRSYRGYCRLFRQAGLELRTAWISPGGLDGPGELVPLHTGAIRMAMNRRSGRGLRPCLRNLLARAWIWRWIASGFVFLLEPAPAAEAAPDPTAPGGWMDAAIASLAREDRRERPHA